MSEITQTEAIEKALMEVIGAEAAEKVANLKGKELEEVYSLVFEQASYYDVLPKEITVKGLVQELYEFTESDCLERWSVPSCDSGTLHLSKQSDSVNSYNSCTSPFTVISFGNTS